MYCQRALENGTRLLIGNTSCSENQAAKACAEDLILAAILLDDGYIYIWIYGKKMSETKTCFYDKYMALEGRIEMNCLMRNYN